MAATLSLASPLLADTKITGKVKDQYVMIYEPVEVVDTFCEIVSVPVYETQQRSGNAAGGALLGMIIGGATGKVITGKDNGAAAGAVIGGIIGADQGNKPKTEQVLVGYREEKQCYEEVTYRDEPKKVYSHSTLVFTTGGKEYSIDFVK